MKENMIRNVRDVKLVLGLHWLLETRYCKVGAAIKVEGLGATFEALIYMDIETYVFKKRFIINGWLALVSGDEDKVTTVTDK